MIVKKADFLMVLVRLKLALACEEDAAVAARLGLSQTAFNNRKQRGSLPIDKINALIQNEKLNPRFIYQGLGTVHLDSDYLSWDLGFRKRIQTSINDDKRREALVRQGNDPEFVNAVIQGEQRPSPRLLRDIHVLLGVDINWLVLGEPHSCLNHRERHLIDTYRQASPAGQAFILKTVSMMEEATHEGVQIKQVGKSHFVQVGGAINKSKIVIKK